MTEQTDERKTGTEEIAPARSRDAVTDTAEGSDSARVREVIGRRGYDESEDEAANEDEQH